jgi:glycosyltransferase involved in cell wall biosynthesis
VLSRCNSEHPSPASLGCVVEVRVLQVFQPVAGGVPTYVHDLTMGLRTRGSSVTVACDPTCEVADRLTRAGVQIAPFVAGRGPSLQDARALGQLAEVVRRERPGLIHAHSSKAGLIAGIIGRALRVPTIYTPHGWSFQMHGPDALRGTYAATEGLLARHAHSHVVAVCASERAIALRWHVARPDDIVVVHTGRRSIATPLGYGEARARLGLGPRDDRVVAAWVGRAGSGKGAEGLPALARQLATSGVTLAALGSGLAQAGIASGVEAAGGIAVPNSLSPHALLSASDLLVSTSAWEGLPLVVLEALEHSLPVVAYRVGGLPEQVFEGVNGHLVPAGDACALASKVTAVAQCPATLKRLGTASRRVWSRRFQPETMVQRMELVYAHVLEQG